MDTVKQSTALCQGKIKVCLEKKKKKVAVNAKCGYAKIYGLRLGFSNSNLSSHV